LEAWRTNHPAERHGAHKRALATTGGAQAVVAAGAQDWREQVKVANDGNPINVVFDPLGGDATDPSWLRGIPAVDSVARSPA
jgi:NADPH:quinone reductase-like Zn-dependent oxidoreductase